MRPNPSEHVQEDVPVLSASEIASYAFCRRAWHLGRQNAARNAVGSERLAAGTVAHRQIGGRADRVRATELGRRMLIVASFGLAIILPIELLSGGTLALPW
jgi:hypothetical protein